jgi:hypothetical protein
MAIDSSPTLAGLPTELQLQIIEDLPWISVMALKFTCRYFYNTITMERRLLASDRDEARAILKRLCYWDMVPRNSRLCESCFVYRPLTTFARSPRMAVGTTPSRKLYIGHYHDHCLDCLFWVGHFKPGWIIPLAKERPCGIGSVYYCPHCRKLQSWRRCLRCGRCDECVESDEQSALAFCVYCWAIKHPKKL